MADVVFIGPGRMGTALALAFQASSNRVLGAVARPNRISTRQSAGGFGALLGVPVVEMDHAGQLCRMAEALFFTVPDRQIQTVVEMYVEQGFIHAGQIVVHTSGALASDILHAVHRVGAFALSLHPLQTIANPSRALELLRGATVAVEGDDHAVDVALTWIHEFGGVPVRLDADAKVKYHAAAVLASNALVALVGLAADLAALPNGIDGLLPLVRGAVDNLTHVGVPSALTGPIERGDIPTIERHLEALQAYPTALAVYSALGKAMVDMAVDKGSLTEEMRVRVQTVIQDWELGGRDSSNV